MLVSLLFTFTIRHPVLMREGAPVSPRLAKIVALVSVLLWSGVGIMGRGIEFY